MQFAPDQTPEAPTRGQEPEFSVGFLDLREDLKFLAAFSKRDDKEITQHVWVEVVKSHFPSLTRPSSVVLRFIRTDGVMGRYVDVPLSPDSDSEKTQQMLAQRFKELTTVVEASLVETLAKVTTKRTFRPPQVVVEGTKEVAWLHIHAPEAGISKYYKFHHHDTIPDGGVGRPNFEGAGFFDVPDKLEQHELVLFDPSRLGLAIKPYARFTTGIELRRRPGNGPIYIVDVESQRYITLLMPKFR